MTFGSLGEVYSTKVAQIVRHVTPDATIYALHGSTATLTCGFYGDALSGATTWKKNGADIADDDTYDIMAGNYANYERTDKLEIPGVENENDGAYKCEAVYTDGNVVQSSTQTLNTLG